jgi:hypothetical protein
MRVARTSRERHPKPEISRTAYYVHSRICDSLFALCEGPLISLQTGAPRRGARIEVPIEEEVKERRQCIYLWAGSGGRE